MLNREVRDFCKYFYINLRHPFQAGIEEKLETDDLELALDFLEEILEAKVSEERLQDLESRFNSAFENYINLPRSQIGALCNSIEKLASLLDPFLKKLAYNFFPKKQIRKGKKLIPLWRSSDFADILDELQISKSDLKNSQDTFWVQQNCKQAILRIAFVTRHKGVHESHRYILQDLERIAYGTIGSYVVICLNIIRAPSLKAVFKQSVEQRHFAALLREKTEAFGTTGTFLSENEHLNIYRCRSAINPSLEEARFLFTSYLSGSGPVFFWLGKYKKNIKIKWAKQCLRMQDELAKRNAMRYLLESDKRCSFKDIVDIFSEYNLKVELADYIFKFAAQKDIDILLHLCRSKAEEVSDAAFKALCRIIHREEDPVLQALVLSSSMYKRCLLQCIIRSIAKKERIDEYRRFDSVKNNAKQIVVLYCLGEVGEKKDIALIKKWLNVRRRNATSRYVGWYSIGRISSKKKYTNLVMKLLKGRQKFIRIAAFEALTREGIGPRFNYLFSYRNIPDDLRNNVIAQISKKEDLGLIKQHLKKVILDNNSRELILAVCKLGGASEFDFLMDLFSNYSEKIEFWNHVKVASDISKLCSRKKRPYLKNLISSPEFWEYCGSKRPKVNPMPIKSHENLPLMRRIVAASFCKVATQREMPILRKLLKHNYEWISFISSLALMQFAKEEDLNWLIRESLSSKEDSHQKEIIVALRRLDKNMYE